MADRVDPESDERFWTNVRAMGAFFMGDDPVHSALRKITSALDELGVPYALVGAMALNEYGYRRATVDVDILLTDESLARFKAAHLGRGYVEKFPGSRGVRDTENNVPIDFVITGHYPGDGKPKPVQFPDPTNVVERRGGVPVLRLARLVELKLASGMSSLDRARDLADVVELVRHAKLPRELSDELDASVRATYIAAWEAVQGSTTQE